VEEADSTLIRRNQAREIETMVSKLVITTCRNIEYCGYAHKISWDDRGDECGLNKFVVSMGQMEKA